MKQKLKRFMAGFMAMLTLVGTLFTNGTTAFAASPQASIAGKYQRAVSCCFFNFYELACGSFTQWALFGSCISFVYVTAYSTSKFFHFLSDFN